MNETVQRTVKGYELRERVGAGGFGEVYRAFQPSVGREVAVKVILPQHANHPDFIRRFEAEAQTVARLEHPHIVPLYDYWRDPEGAYLVMRWLPQTLRAALKGGALPPAQVAQLLEQVCAALTVAHRENVIHRDLKPDNILLDEDRNAYVADFGIAINLNTRAPSKEGSAFYGSPEYVSPEQIRGQALTPRSDIYSLGFVLYELLTGEKPFPDAKTPSDYVQKHLTEPVPTISSRHPSVPAALDEVLSTATAKDPAARYASAQRLAAAFRAALPSSIPRITGQPLPDPLTQRELDILRLVVEGLSNGEIAERLFLSTSTIKWYMKQVYAKLDVHSRSQAVERAERLGLFAPHPGAVEQEPNGDGGRMPSQLLVQAGEPVNPYKGLRAFQESDAHDFFGRAALVEQLLNRLSDGGDDARFLAVVGPSGSGKSSVVSSGLIPALRRGALAASPRPFIAQMFPGAHPFDELEAALLRVSTSPLDQLRQQLQEDRRGLARVVKRLLPADLDTELILVIDQFEELFTLVEAEDVRARFLDNLLSAITDPRGRVRVIVTLRADFYDRPLLYPRLGELVRTHTELVLPMTARELEQAIVAPAERAGVQFEGGLVATIINEVGEQPGALPLMQYALTELFERREGVVLTSAAYRTGGGVTGALARRADELYADLSEEGKAAARQLFLRLVTLGEGTEDTRRRVLLAELNALDGDGTMEEVINAFADYRLLTVDRDPLTRSPTVEIAHEALIREWGMLGEWLDASRDEIRLQRRLAHAAAEWNTARDPSFLASGARLAQFETLASQSNVLLTPDERAFIDASAAEHERALNVARERQARALQLARQSAHRLHLLVAVLAVAVVGALLLSGVAITSANTASTEANLRATQQAIAEANFNRAEQQRLYLAANEAMDEGASGNVGMTLALASLDFGYSAGADAALLRATRQGVVVHRLKGNLNEVNSVAYSPDGKLIATSSNQGTWVYDAQTGDQRFLLPTEEDSNVGYALFHPSGTMLVSSRSSGIIQFWDVQTGEEIKHYNYAEGTVFVGFGRGGDSLFTMNFPREIREWDTATGELLREIDLPQDVYALGTGAGTSPEELLYLTDDHAVALLDLETEQEFCRIPAAVEFVGIVSADMTADGSILLYQTEDKYVHVVDIAACSEVVTHKIIDGNISWYAFSADNETVYTSDTAGGIYHWEMRTGLVINHIMGMNASVYAIALSPDERYLASAGFAPDAYVFDLAFPHEPRFYQSGLMGTWRVNFTANGQGLVVGGPFNATRLDLSSGEITQEYAMEGGIRDFVFSPDAASLFVSSASPIGPDDHSTYLLDAMTGAQIRDFSGHTDTVNHVAYSPDGTRVASGAWDGTARIWDAANGEALITYNEHTDVVSHVAFSPDGQLVLSTSGDGTAHLWDVNTGERLQVFRHESVILVGVFSPDGTRIVTTDIDGFANVWDIQTGDKLHTLVGHRQAIWAAMFSMDGRMIATSGDGVRLWDAQTGSLIRVLPPLNLGGESWPAFSPDGQYLAVGSMDSGQVTAWRVSLEDVIEAICSQTWLEVTPEERAQYGIPDDVTTCPGTPSEPAA